MYPVKVPPGAARIMRGKIPLTKNDNGHSDLCKNTGPTHHQGRRSIVGGTYIDLQSYA